MRSCNNTIWALALAMLGSSAVMATPTIAVSTPSITTEEVGTVQISGDRPVMPVVPGRA